MRAWMGETSFAGLRPAAARAVLIVFALSIAFCLAVSLSPWKIDNTQGNRKGAGDVSLYRAEVDHIRAGQGYYEAAAHELRQRGYPTRSVFNWRTPLPMWLAGSIGLVPAKLLLCAAALAIMLIGFGWLEREAGTLAAAVGALLLFGALLPCLVGDLFLMPEVWAGVLIALSICLYACDRPQWGAAVGILALFVRELSAVYCVTAIALAVAGRHRRELTVWSAGVVAYACFYALHLHAVAGLIRADDIAHRDGWLQLGAAPFVISAFQMNCLLLLLPQWVTALYVPLAMLGLAATNSDAGGRVGLAVSLFAIAFAFIGQPFNQYWGSMFAPLAALGAARAPAALGDLWRASGSRWPAWATRMD